MHTVRRISIGSAFKVGAATYALMWVVFGGLLLLFQLAFGGLIASTGEQEALGAFGLMAGGGIIFYFIGIVLYGVLGGIGSAIAAFIYNLVATMVGGLKVEMESQM